MAIFLGRAGYAVRGFELRADPRQGAAAAGRSINLALSARGLQALGEARLRETIVSLAVPMRGRMIHPERGAPVFQPYGTADWHANHSVSRADLNLALLEAAENLQEVRFTFHPK